MGKEYKGGHFKFQYKTPATSMDKGLWELENDDDILTMYMLIPASRLIEKIMFQNHVQKVQV